MGSSEGNKINDGTGFKPTEPELCVKGCGFFGGAATMGLCSKCYRDFCIQEQRMAPAKAALNNLVRPQAEKVDGCSSLAEAKAVDPAAAAGEEKKAAPTNRCLSCNKKVGVMGFQCRCGSTFCGAHRYPESHGCTFDFRGQGRASIAKANPVIKADKLDRM